jgi:cobalt-zinc-cadmium efflux system outer membrane protein
VDAAQAGIESANASRYKDPSVNLFIERDRFNNQRETYSGISVSMELPLWNSNRREQSVARAELINARTEHELQLRELNSQLQQSYMHYAHLLEQQKAYRSQLLTPAKQMFELSRESFAAGEENILGLIDSHNSYFEIHAGYLEILASIAQELAHLRYAAGLSLLGTDDISEMQPGAAQ